jgi:hypothetical protein
MEGKRFVRGHWSRSPEARAVYTARRVRPVENSNPGGMCQCGCGQITPLATDNHPERGYYKGQHQRYIAGHHVKKGAESSHWKGGRIITPSGYVYLFLPDHPRANAKGYIYEHRVVVERRLGRLLEPGERVHHLNHDRGDNRDENLVLFPSHSAHLRAEHPHGLDAWMRANPTLAAKQRSESGRKGAAGRWGRKK